MATLFLILSALFSLLFAEQVFNEQIEWPVSRNLLTGQQEITSMSDYTVIFDRIDCELRVYHTESQTRIYKAKASEIVQTGQGDIDAREADVIVEGNIAYYPEVSRQSKGFKCPTHSVKSVGTEGAHGSMVQLDGEVEVNMGCWLKPKQVTIPTQIRVRVAEDKFGVLISSSILDD